MGDEKLHHVIVEEIVREAKFAGNRDEMNRAFAAIEGRPMPDPETHLSQLRPPRRKPKGSSR